MVVQKQIPVVMIMLWAALGARTACCQNTQNKPLIERSARVAIARNILETIRSPDAEPKPEHRADTKNMALIDPIVAFELIVGNLAPDDGPSWDHAAIMTMAAQPHWLTDDQWMQLLDSQPHEFAGLNYIVAILEHLPKDRVELQSRLRNFFQTKQFEHPHQGLPRMLFRLNIAKKLGLKTMATDIENEIHTHYASGEARRDYDNIKDQPNASDWVRIQRAVYGFHAPTEFKKEFADAPPANVWTILRDRDLEPATKVVKLRLAAPTSIGRFSHEYMRLATALGEIAVLDRTLADELNEQLPDEGARAWADINIAAWIHENDPAKAKQLIRAAYGQLSTLAEGDRESERAYNYPVALIGAIGLPAVERFDAEYLPEAIGHVIQAAPSMLTSRLADARANYFEVVAGVARYDRQRAKELFQAAADDVDLHAAASFFVALAALNPDSIVEEYGQIPVTPDSRGIAYRPYICNALIPALCASDDDGFWDALAQHSLMNVGLPKDTKK